MSRLVLMGTVLISVVTSLLIVFSVTIFSSTDRNTISTTNTTFTFPVTNTITHTSVVTVTFLEQSPNHADIAAFEFYDPSHSYIGIYRAYNWSKERNTVSFLITQFPLSHPIKEKTFSLPTPFYGTLSIDSAKAISVSTDLVSPPQLPWGGGFSNKDSNISYLETISSTDIALLTSGTTIEFWIELPSIDPYEVIHPLLKKNTFTVSLENTVSASKPVNFFTLQYRMADNIWTKDGGNITRNLTQPGWYHMAITYKHDEQGYKHIATFVNGLPAGGSKAGPNAEAPLNLTDVMQVAHLLPGRIDDIRLSETVRYKSGTEYMVPLEPLNCDEFTVALWNFDETEEKTWLQNKCGSQNVDLIPMYEMFAPSILSH